MKSNKEFGEVKAKLDALASTFEDFRTETRVWQGRCEDMIVARLGGQLETQATRIRALEIWQGWITGALATLAVIWGLFRFAFDWWRK